MKGIKSLVIIWLLLQPLFLSSQIDFDKQYEISVKAIEAIKANDYNSFIELVNEDILAQSDLEAFKGYIKSASEIVNKYETVAPKDLLLIGVSQSAYKNKQIDILSVGFQFPPPKKQTMISEQNLLFLFSDEIDEEKMVGFRIQDFTAHEKLLSDKANNVPHLDSFNFNAKSVNWFRIWYDKGPTENNFGNEDGVYALSGDNKTLKKAKVEELLNEIFELVNQASIDSTDIHTRLGGQTVGKSEYLYLRMKFDDKAYKSLDQFTMTAIFNEEEGIQEVNKDYLIIRHSRSHRYYINLNEQELLRTKLRELAYRDYGNLLEKNP